MLDTQGLPLGIRALLRGRLKMQGLENYNVHTAGGYLAAAPEKNTASQHSQHTLKHTRAPPRFELVVLRLYLLVLDA
jgi:hypothetical protein